MRELAELRAALDALDPALTELFLERMALSAEVGEWKAAQGLPVLDAARESDLLACRAAAAPEYAEEVTALYRTILALSRRRQRRRVRQDAPSLLPPCRGSVEVPRVLYQGEPGAYADEAAQAFFGGGAARGHTPTWEDIFLALQGGQADYGVLPIENSSTGGIAQVYDLLARYNCFLVAEEIVQVRHCLMGLPGAKPDDIAEVCSHEQGFLQCRSFFEARPHLRRTARLNTAESAKHVAEGDNPAIAAVCSRRAGLLYGLVPMAEDIHDNTENYTRFVVVSPVPERRAGSNKMSAVLTLPHRSGSLYEMMGIFATAGLNLLKLESRPIRGRSWEYDFFVDFSGSLDGPGMDETLAELRDACVSFRLLGNYPEHGA